MSEQVAVGLEFWKEQCAQARQSEDQRATMTNLVLAVTAADVGFVTQQHLARSVLPATVLLVVLGLFGMVSSAKYYERFRYHRTHALAIRRDLSQRAGLTYGEDLVAELRAHNVRFRRMHQVRLHHLWTALHAGIAATGVVLTVLAAT